MKEPAEAWPLHAHALSIEFSFLGMTQLLLQPVVGSSS